MEVKLPDPDDAKILIVEDNEGDVLLIKEALKDSKALTHLDTVYDGASALAFLHKEAGYEDALTPDLILLDLNLPGIDGQQVLQEVKSDLHLRYIPVVIFTSSKEPGSVLICYELYANCYIKKPSRFSEYASVIKTIEDFWFSTVKLPPSR